MLIEVNVSGILGYQCMGAAVYENALMPIELSEEEFSALKSFYKGKESRNLKEIKNVMPKLYRRINKSVCEQEMDFFGMSTMENDINFPEF